MTIIIVFICAALIIAFFGYFIMLYNGLVELRNNVKKAWSNIDVLLKQRHDMLPKLIDACKQYMGYEQSTLQEVIAARNSVNSARENSDTKALKTAETGMQKSLKSLFALAENYPDLKANNSFLQLQNSISDIETRIAERREYYNENAALNNTRIEQFPSNIVANMFHFGHEDLLQIDVADKQDIDVADLFNNK